MLFKLLNRLRKKPAHVRQRITFLVSLSISLVIFSLWWSSFNARDPVVNRDTMAANAPSPARALGETLKSGKDMIANTLSGLQTFKEKPEGDAPSPLNDVVYPEDIFDDKLNTASPDTIEENMPPAPPASGNIGDNKLPQQ